MLRDFISAPYTNYIYGILNQYKISPNDLNDNTILQYQLVGFKILTPDSFIWELIIDDAVYYLYAEDYVENLSHVKSAIKSYDKTSISLDFVEVYNPPISKNIQIKNDDKSTKYIVKSGYDLVFLLRTDKRVTDAYFNI